MGGCQPCPHGFWCTAGLTVACEIGFYNPITNANSQTACLKCPEFSTSTAQAATSVDDCVCLPGFIKTLQNDGTQRCECDAGNEIVNGVRCNPCSFGMFKPAAGNSKCTGASRTIKPP